MRSQRKQKNLILSFLLLFTVFLYGCGGSAGVQESTVRIEMRDVTTKAPIEDVQVVINAPDPNPTSGAATHLRRQLATDSRGKVVFSNLPPDRTYSLTVSKDGFTALAGADNDAPAWIPAIDGGTFIAEQGKTYEFIGYMRRADSPTTGTIRGYVYDQLTGQPITNATVFITVTNAGGQNYSIIDTTNKPSKQGYFELNDVPSGTQNLQVTSPGYIGTNVPVTIPQGGTIDFDVNLATSLGTLRLTLQAQAGEVFMQNYLFLVQVLRNGTTIVGQQVVSPDADGTKILSVTFGGDNTGIPVIPTGSTDTYTIKVVSEHAHMVNPANGLTGIVLRGRTVDGDGGGGAAVGDLDAGTIILAVEKGVIDLTLYQPQGVNLNVNQTDALLREQASQATMLVENASITSRYTGESPNYYFHYILEEVPVGNRKIFINFPGHQLADGGNNEIDGVTVLKDKTTKLLRTMQWTTN